MLVFTLFLRDPALVLLGSALVLRCFCWGLLGLALVLPDLLGFARRRFVLLGFTFGVHWFRIGFTFVLHWLSIGVALVLR